MREELEHARSDLLLLPVCHALRLSHISSLFRIVDTAEQCRSAQRAIDVLTSDLSAMMDLPPDLALARVRLEERRLELERLRREVALLTDAAATTMYS